jgi:hypothetical protein
MERSGGREIKLREAQLVTLASIIFIRITSPRRDGVAASVRALTTTAHSVKTKIDLAWAFRAHRTLPRRAASSSFGMR